MDGVEHHCFVIFATEDNNCVCEQVSDEDKNKLEENCASQENRLLQILKPSHSPTDSTYTAEIKYLNLSDCQLKSIDPSLSLLVNLLELNLSANQLSSLPETLVAFKKLHTLDLSSNKFQTVPSCVTKLNFIINLNLSLNPLIRFDEPLNCSSFLKHLNMSHTKIEALPKWLFTDSRVVLEVLNLSHTKCFFKSISADILYQFEHSLSFFSKSLKKLDLSFCCASPNNLSLLSYFDNLQCLNIGNGESVGQFNAKLMNCLWDLPPSLFSNKNLLSSLTSLNVSNSSLSTLSEDIYLLSSLKVLDVSYNQFNWLPNNLPRLIHLETLNVSNNQISMLPSDFCKLVNLENLFVSHNQIDSVPEDFEKLVFLQYADFYSNNIEDFPTEAIESLRANRLTGLDLAWNNCAIPSEDGSLYLQLQEKYRSVFVTNETRQSTRRPVVEESSDPESDGSFSSEDRSLPPPEVEYVPQEIEEENWGDENSFDDQFDPNLPNLGSRRPSVSSQHETRGTTPPVGYYVRDDIGPLFYAAHEMTFCPSDSHPPSIRKAQTAQTENCGIDISSEQFEDS